MNRIDGRRNGSVSGFRRCNQTLSYMQANRFTLYFVCATQSCLESRSLHVQILDTYSLR